jgi:osmoprotectant transport system ATP-binding protein
MAASVELRDVSVASILRDVSLTIAPGEAVALIGRSGAGKTTALRTMNGLARATSGSVLVGGEDLATADLIALRRRTGYIIQSAGLFPHRSVYDNIATVPRLLAWPDEKIRPAAEAIMKTLGMPIDRFAARFPSSLSGGEQQRVGIARAMIAKPSLLLCDEPFGALDPIVRRELQELFVTLREGVTIVFVTHDLAEALRIAGRIVLLDAGRIVTDTNSASFATQDVPLVKQFVEAAQIAPRPAERGEGGRRPGEGL